MADTNDDLLPHPFEALHDLVTGKIFDAPKKAKPADPAPAPAPAPEKVKPDGTKKRSKRAAPVIVNVGDIWERQPKPGARAGAPAGTQKAKGKAPEESGDDGDDGADE